MVVFSLPLLCLFFYGGVDGWLLVRRTPIKGVLIGLSDEVQYGNQEASRVGFEDDACISWSPQVSKNFNSKINNGDVLFVARVTDDDD